jgi:CMP-N,N'-diacetyllegionaminic acid synthase
MNIVGLIPARAGSKGIPRKNLVSCAGKPLLAYSCEAALQSKKLSRVLLSTDSKEIADAGISFGVEAPFLRPAEIAADTTPMIDVLKHALLVLEKEARTVDALCLLQPTSPLRTATHINEAIALFEKQKADTVVSICEVPHQYTPSSILNLDAATGEVQPYQKSDATVVTRRQDKPKLYARNGPAILIIRADVIRKNMLYGQRTFGYLMAAKDSFDIDHADDLDLVEYLLKKRT